MFEGSGTTARQRCPGLCTFSVSFFSLALLLYSLTRDLDIAMSNRVAFL